MREWPGARVLIRTVGRCSPRSPVRSASDCAVARTPDKIINIASVTVDRRFCLTARVHLSIGCSPPLTWREDLAELIVRIAGIGSPAE